MNVSYRCMYFKKTDILSRSYLDVRQISHRGIQSLVKKIRMSWKDISFRSTGFVAPNRATL